VVPRLDDKLTPFSRKIIGKLTKLMFFLKSYIKKTAGKLATEVRSGDAPKPPLSMKIYENLNNPEINSRSTIEISPYFRVCMF